MSEYISAFEGMVMTDENCQKQQETCYAQCQENARYSAAYDDDNNGGAGRRLSDYESYKQYMEESGYYDQQYGQYQEQQENKEYSMYNGGNYGTNYYRNGNNGNQGQNQYQNNENYDSGEEEDEENDYYNYYNREGRNYANDDEEQAYGQNVDYNNYYDEDYCRYDCMANASMSYCNENAWENGANGYNAINIPQMVQCHQLDYYSFESKPLYVGAACKNGGVYLDVFYDAGCTRSAPKNTHEDAVSLCFVSCNQRSKSVHRYDFD